MTHPRTIAIAAAALFTVPLLAHAAGPMPDVKGTWTGKTLPIVAGSGGHWPDNKGTFDNPGLPEGEVKITIKGQDGQRFWGSKTISGGGSANDEPFIGVLRGPRMNDALIADTDGYMDGTFRGNVFSFCYAHAGGPTKTSLVTCAEAKRQR